MVARQTAVLLDRFPLWLDAVEVVVATVGFDAVERTRTPDEALRLLQIRQPELHVVGFDVFSLQAEALSYVEQARERAPSVNILVLSTDSNPAHIDATLSTGAFAYVLKTAEPDDLAAAIRQAFEHSLYLPGLGMTAAVETPDLEATGLTPREVEVLRFAAEGHSNAELARILFVSEQTVKFHLSNIYKKLEISNRTEASRWAQAHGLLPAA
jgi:DNA-binding NarL/FixJ family response regulator